MDVGEWLRGLGLGQYEEQFRDNKIDADLLPRLTVDDLKDIGVSVVGDRRRLLDAIATIAGAGGPADLAASPRKSAPSKGLQESAERRPITVMFCDLAGSTSLAAKLDAEDWRNLVNAYLDQASAAVTDFGGHVLKKLGDGLMALFGYPHAQENDAERAVRAALAIQRALSDLNARNAANGAPKLSARVGIESGPAVVEAGGEVFGEAPNVAARVQAAAEPGSVLVTGSVQRQIAGLFVVEDKGAHELKGVAQPLSLYRVVRASGGGRRSGARALTSFVGREEDIGTLLRRWDRVRAGEGQFVLIVGEPGLGKSRLIEEFHTRLGETPHTWTECSSSQLLQNTPLHPLAEWGRLRFGEDLPAEQRLADLENTLRLVGLDVGEYAPLIAPLVDIPLPKERAARFAPEELRRRQLAAVTGWFLAGARTQPIVLAFEDLHWADPTSLDLIQSLAECGAQAPLLVVATTRPEFRAPWGMRSHHAVVALAPLDRTEVRRMVGDIAAQYALPQEVVERVSERTGGVPLFVEEVTRLLVERGDTGSQGVPPTLQQSLAARLDRLGEAREVAQIGAVLGRDFAYELLRDVAGLDDSALQPALERLTKVDLLFVEGAPPQANYRFKHALIQDAAYDSLLKKRRQALHRRAAELLRDNPDRATAEPEVIAHHFAQGGLDDLAIEWWGKAGDQALRRSAFQEAIAHLGKAIAMADETTGGNTTGLSGQRQRLQVAYGNALIAARGYGAPETTEAFAKARESPAAGTAELERLSADYGLWGGSYTRGELLAMRAHVETFLADTDGNPDSPEAGVAHRTAGITHWFAGEYREARDHLERALALFQPGHDDDLAFRFGHDVGLGAMLSLALALWPLGEIGRAIFLVDAAEARLAGLTHVGTRAFGTMHSALFEMMRGDLSRAAPNVTELARLAHEHDLPAWRACAVFFEGWAKAESSAPADGLEAMGRAAALLREQNVLVYDGPIKIALAEAEARSGDVERAVAVLDEALATCERIGHRTFEAELHRVRGSVLLKRDPANTAPAEAAFGRAIEIAVGQGTRSFALRAALSLARLYQSTARPADAHAALAPALEGFSATPEMPEIAEALALLASLSETDEVKAAEAHRQRLTQLRVSYGNALLQARGYGAPEMTEAFARAREAASGDKDAPGRLAADYGLWVGSYVRGELPSMQAHAAGFLSDVGASPESPEAGVAHRAAGMTCWFAGEYREARDHLERALALFQPGRDDDLAFRFGHDAGASAMFSLAVVSWPLGEVDRAISLIDRMQTRIAGLAHVGTLAVGRMHAALFELMRGEHARVAPNVLELVRLAREHDLPMQGAFGVFLEGWATAASGAPADGLADERRGVELLRERNVLYFDGLLKIALAEAEARAGDAERAVTILDEALSAVDRTGSRAFEAELHRARGEIQCRDDPANPAPAEDAFLTAIAVAKQQGTRSFQLRAALSLAKLYQSTGRPADAHAILAPALEGFTPTPEMLEIAEAQGLLDALGATDAIKAAADSRRQRVHLQTSYGKALIGVHGYGAPETALAFERAREPATGLQATGLDDSIDRFPATYGVWVGTHVRGELLSMRELAATFLRESASRPNSGEASVGHRIMGATHWFAAEFVEARAHLEQAVAIFDPSRDADLAFRYGQDIGVSASVYSAIVLWPLGEIDLSRRRADDAVTRTRSSDHVATVVYGLALSAIYRLLIRDPEGAQPITAQLGKAAEDLQSPQYLAFHDVLGGWLAWRSGSGESALLRIRRGIAQLKGQGFRTWAPLTEAMLAEVESEAGDSDSAMVTIARTIAEAERLGQCWYDAELHRIRGEILLKQAPSVPAPAEEAFLTAIATARRQKTRSFELRAALSLAKLYQSTNRPAEAHAVLAPALEGFSPTPEMPEIAEAQALLATFAEMGEVKVAIAQRQRRLDLQTSYALAVSFSKGSAADETKAAFVRAGDLATRAEFPAERFSALFGHAYWSLQRGEVRAARDIAERILREAEADERSSAFGDARRVLGLAFLFLGDLAKARSEFELALNSFDMESEARENFLWDAGAACRASLAQASWYSGDIHRARQLIKETIGSGRELGPPPSTAYVLSVKIYIEGHRNDLESVLADAENLLKVGQQHGMDFYVAISRIYLSWARGGLGDVRSGLDELRSSLDTYATQGNRLGTPYFLGCLAELEAAAGDDERALALIDEGLAMANEGGQQVWDAFLHRLRGDILLKRDPTKSAPAEEAYQTAIVIAKRQGARSYELLASFALAKLYQSSARPAEAYAVLAPALEGFSPTPEMPEIAEARALLVAIEADAHARHE